MLASVQGPAHCTLKAGGPVGRLVQRVQVVGQQVAGPGAVAGVPGRQPPAGRLQVHRQPGQQGGAAAGQVGVLTTGRQLGQERQVGQLTEDGADGLTRVGARHAPDAGGAAPGPGHPAARGRRDGAVIRRA
jgi:hypothetical protein